MHFDVFLVTVICLIQTNASEAIDEAVPKKFSWSRNTNDIHDEQPDSASGSTRVSFDHHSNVNDESELQSEKEPPPRNSTEAGMKIHAKDELSESALAPIRADWKCPEIEFQITQADKLIPLMNKLIPLINNKKGHLTQFESASIQIRMCLTKEGTFKKEPSAKIWTWQEAKLILTTHCLQMG